MLTVIGKIIKGKIISVRSRFPDEIGVHDRSFFNLVTIQVKVQPLRHEGTKKKNMKFVFVMSYPSAN